MKKILIIEDDAKIRRFLQLELEHEGYQIDLAENGEEGLSKVQKLYYDIILLDLMLPLVSGEEVCKKIRGVSEVPVIVITAKDDIRNKVELLDMGADDYITKPFNIEELFARIRVVLRRYKPQDVRTNDFKLGGLLVNFEKRKVYINDEEIHLTPIEYKMLVLLIQNQGKVLTHRFIQQEIWGSPTTDDYQSLRVFMSNIRRKIETDTSEPKFIKTEVGVGYRLVEE